MLSIIYVSSTYHTEVCTRRDALAMRLWAAVQRSEYFMVTIGRKCDDERNLKDIGITVDEAGLHELRILNVTACAVSARSDVSGCEARRMQAVPLSASWTRCVIRIQQ